MPAIALLLCAAPTVARADTAAESSTPNSPGDLRAVESVRPLGNERLSDERTLTRWAHAAWNADVRSKPRPGAKAVGKLRYLTEDGKPEVYVALDSRRRSSGAIWIRVRIPGRPNGRTGWVPRTALGEFTTVRTYLEIDKSEFRAILYRGRKILWSSRIGHGAPGTPTPSGEFYIRERLPNFGGGGVYGPLAFGTSAYSKLSDWPGGGVVGIHGTSQPGLIPGRPSHGCVRLPNAAVLRLDKLMKIGTPVRIKD